MALPPIHPRKSVAHLYGAGNQQAIDANSADGSCSPRSLSPYEDVMLWSPITRVGRKSPLVPMIMERTDSLDDSCMCISPRPSRAKAMKTSDYSSNELPASILKSRRSSSLRRSISSDTASEDVSSKPLRFSDQVAVFSLPMDEESVYQRTPADSLQRRRSTPVSYVSSSTKPDLTIETGPRRLPREEDDNATCETPDSE